MRRIQVLMTALLLAACERGSQGVAPSDGAGVPKAPAAKDADTKADTKADAKADTKAGAPKADEPYRRAGNPAEGVDEFVFWGWSEDGNYYAFETFHHGADMANCEGEAELSIVDAQADRYAEDGHVVVVHKEPEAEVCDPPDLREELAHRRTPRLERYGISADYVGGPIPIEPKGGDGTHWSFTPPDGGPIALSFRVLHGTDDPMMAIDGAAFELEIQQEGMSPVVIENGRRRRPWTLGYGLDQGMAFVGPKGRHAAIMVAQRMTMPEGVRTTWMSSGVTLR
ncbi:MAG: hypothetical protein KDK70_31105 [Myxococcales bacterium]|nr:hypothetical protein [Myxococcales bacterium]